jgi:hypothetical protein
VRLNSDAIVGQGVVSTTQSQYAPTFKFISLYCSQHYPDAVDENGELILPMTQENLESFLGDMASDGHAKQPLLLQDTAQLLNITIEKLN